MVPPAAFVIYEMNLQFIHFHNSTYTAVSVILDDTDSYSDDMAAGPDFGHKSDGRETDMGGISDEGFGCQRFSWKK